MTSHKNYGACEGFCLRSTSTIAILSILLPLATGSIASLREPSGEKSFVPDWIKPQSLDYGSYINLVNGPLQDSDLENTLDTLDKDLIEQFNFDPQIMLALLIDRAAARTTTPVQFIEDIQDLVALQNRKEADSEENADTPAATESPEITTARFDLTTLVTAVKKESRSTEHKAIVLKQLEEKYNISSACSVSDCITAARLALMFPHYIDIGQRPFTAPTYDEEITTTTSTTTTTDYYGYRKRHNYYPTPDYSQTSSREERVRTPLFFSRPEFGGLIPQSLTDQTARRKLMAIHLYSMYHDEDDETSSVPFRTKCVLLRWRMERSMASDKRRIRFLQNNGLVDEDGKLTIKVDNLDALIPQKFYNKIFWKVLGS